MKSAKGGKVSVELIGLYFELHDQRVAQAEVNAFIKSVMYYHFIDMYLYQLYL